MLLQNVLREQWIVMLINVPDLVIFNTPHTAVI